jgi:hypothetical protein
MALVFSGFATKITGDFRVAPLKGKNRFCFAWFNSEYLHDETALARQEIDQAYKAKAFKMWV